MKRTNIILVLLLLGLLTLSGMTSAQGVGSFSYCGDLPEADCDLLMASQEAMATLTSSAIDMSMFFDISGVPDMPVEKLAFTLNINGAGAVDPELAGMMHDMQSNPMQFADPQASIAMVGDLIDGVSGDFTISVELPPDLLAMAAPGEDIPSTLTFDLRMIDGVVYINLDKLANAMPDAEVPPGWMGADLSALWSQVGDMALAMGDMSGSLDSDAMSEYMGSMMDPAYMGQFLSVQRVADSEAMGQTLAVFEYTFDLAAFMSSDVYQEMLQAQMSMAVGDAELSAEDQAEIDEMMSTMIAAMEDMSFVQTMAIGLDDNYIHSANVTMDWNMDELINTFEPSAESSGAVFTFTMSIDWSDFNTEVVVEVPEDAMLIPLGSMLPSADNF